MESAAMRFACLFVAALVAAMDPAAAAAPFLERATTPYECGSLAAARGGERIWTGRFFGARESLHDDDPRGDLVGPPRSTGRTACFVSEQACRNWLYNMQSVYTAAVWTADCRRGLPR